MKSLKNRCAALLLPMLGSLLCIGSPSFAGDTQRVSVSSAGAQGTAAGYRYGSYDPSFSANGRYVSFTSDATGIVPGGTPGLLQIYVKNLQTGAVERVSADANGVPGNNGGDNSNFSSGSSNISADGRYVAFGSQANNLVPGDTNGVSDVFVKDRQTGAIQRVNTDANGNQGNPGENGSFSGYPHLSSDGRYVVFLSTAPNLVPGDTNGVTDVFVKDRQTGAIERITPYVGNDPYVAVGTAQISGDGRFVVFQTSDGGLVPNDTNNAADVFLKDRQTGVIQRVSEGTGGLQSDKGGHSPSLSADGRYVSFISSTSYLVNGDTNDFEDVFVKDRQTGVLERVSVTETGVQIPNQGYYYGFYPAISPNGRYVSFYAHFPANYFGIFVKDRQTGELELVSRSTAGAAGNGSGSVSAFSGDGRLAFDSQSTNLVTGDTNNIRDVFVRTLDRAEFVSQNVPAMQTGGVYTVSVTMKNTGATTWTREAGFVLTSQNPRSNGTWGEYLVYLPEGVSVATGQSHTFVWGVKAPSAPGTYNFQWQMAQLGVGWFGDYTANVAVQVSDSNKAQFVSQSVPTHLNLGEQATVSVTMKNTGASTWSHGAGFVLSSQNPLSNTNWGPNLVYLSAGVSVAPGQSHTFTFPITAPSTAGTYNFQWRMAQAGVGWFGDFSANVAVKVAATPNKAEFVSQTAPPTTMTPGQKAVVSVTMKNTGSTTWTYGNGFVLSAQNPLANNTWGTSLRYLPGNVSVAPGQSHTFTFVATAPTTPGVYHFQWRMAQSGVEWFGGLSPDVTVTVQ